jgi:hypothetical protein
MTKMKKKKLNSINNTFLAEREGGYKNYKQNCIFGFGKDGIRYLASLL